MYLSNPNGQADWKIDRYYVGGGDAHVRRMPEYDPEMLLWAAVIELAVADTKVPKDRHYDAWDKANSDSAAKFLDTLRPGDLIYECALALSL